MTAVDPSQKVLRFLPERVSGQPQASAESPESFENGGKSQSASFESFEEKTLKKLIKEKGYKFVETKGQFKPLEEASQQEVKA